MPKETVHIPLDQFVADVRAVFERVAATGESVVVDRADGVSAVLRPAPGRRQVRIKRGLTAAGHEAFLRTAGGWHDVDTEALKRNIEESRGLPPREPVEL
ncbi:MAG: hypothetical protein EXR51_08100 [Dehalococcoidia bacterium]|nr:hypothetical protein [Dehalococcoidia bacterium]